ncbi:relaxase/mobilization nuclease domain-containing protein [Sphingobacterium thalpophilum]|uniref:Relaxase/mobilization nuclease domain-containing protein n=1 Tax=Sphingobacterium thalpophilum TaxID=259 RepID=A0ABV4H9W0_9SPHI
MIAKIIKSNAGFSASLDYCLNRKEAKIIYSDGIRLGDPKFLTKQFELLAKCNERIKNPLGHIVLSFSKNLDGKLSDNMMSLIAQDYLNKMGIKNTALIVVRHSDKKHPHCHIVYSKNGYNNRKLNEDYLKLRSLKAVREMNLKYGFANSREQSPYTDSKNKYYQVKKEIRYYLKQGTSGSNARNNWRNLTHYLNSKGISIEFKSKGNSEEIQGVSFSKDGFRFKGSEIGREFSFSKIEQSFSAIELPTNNKEEDMDARHEVKQSEFQTQSLLGLLDLGGVIAPEPEDDPSKRKRKRKI